MHFIPAMLKCGATIDVRCRLRSKTERGNSTLRRCKIPGKMMSDSGGAQLTQCRVALAAKLGSLSSATAPFSRKVNLLNP